jgi:hypothetical protein
MMIVIGVWQMLYKSLYLGFGQKVCKEVLVFSTDVHNLPVIEVAQRHDFGQWCQLLLQVMLTEICQ